MRFLYQKVFGSVDTLKPKCIEDPNLASTEIINLLKSDKPVMIARFGSTELTCVANYLGVISPSNSWSKYVKGIDPPWWWNKKIIKQMNSFSGFFPTRIPEIIKFCCLMLDDMKELDLLGSWTPVERYFENNISDIPKINLALLDPYFSDIPWTTVLKGKRVLVIHPFSKSIVRQYEKRKLLFCGNVLPDFKLLTIKAVQTIGKDNLEYSSWFDALEYMKMEMDNIDYDICLIGAGAYGFALAAHAKRQGKKAVHMGGSLQLLFGIRGRRWESLDYKFSYNERQFNYWSLMNEHWVRPDIDEKPEKALQVEGGCYW